MKKPSIIKFRVLKKTLKKYRIELKFGGKHHYFEDMFGNKYPIPYRNDSDDVEKVYVEAIRRRFKLNPEDGIEDESFYSKK